MSSTEHQFNGRPTSYWLDVRTTGDDETRWEAVDAIRHLCSPEDSIPLFLDTLRNDSYLRARGLAAHAIFDLACCPNPEPVLVTYLSEIIDLIEDDSRDVQIEIIETLRFLGSPAIASVQSLRSIAESDDKELASLARTAIQAIDA